MRKKLLFLIVALGICALGMQRPASALSNCSNAYCANTPAQQCVCPPNTHYRGRIMLCGSWYADCQGF